MKLSTIFLTGLTSAAKTDGTAISTLNNLRNMSTEIFLSLLEAYSGSECNWPCVILPTSAVVKKRRISKWRAKFENNSVQMRRSFDRCGTRDGEAIEEINLKNDVENPCRTINQLLNGFSMWTERYISSCNGQKKKSHQKKRLKKWTERLNEGSRLKLKLFRIYDTQIMRHEIQLEYLN